MDAGKTPDAARPHPPVVPDPEQGCDACGEPMTNYDADGQWCDKHGKPSAAYALERSERMTLIKNPNGRISRFLFWLRWNLEGRA